MKNSDMPAMPIELSGFNQFAPEAHTGLTKREMFAMHAMSAALDKYNPYESGDFDSSDWEVTARNAVGLADALLAELEK
ncbi:hypothetical protein [Pseudoalteromonas sp.]|uniref:hypothetical protein n=1 Tax=Pseudoalteromonas sp. TaxID=53249 RepID=UPI003D151D8B